MLHTALKSILAHKLRLLSTTIAIVLGVAFIAGTYVLTDTMKAGFDEVFASINSGIDLAVRGEAEFTSSLSETDRPLVTADAVEGLRQVDGVAAVNPQVSGFAVLLDADGEPIGGQGPPTLGVNGPSDDELTQSTLREGRYPQAADEVAVDAATVAANGFTVGQTVQVVIDGPTETYTLVGVFGFGEVDNLAGATVTMFEPDHAAQLYGDNGFEEVWLALEDGADPAAVRDAVAASVGDGFEVLTGDELAQSVTAEINEGLGFFTTALLVFAGVALFVGAFLIANTFSIIVAQRTRELALLRAVGASRRQVLGSVLVEAFVVGVIGSLVGLGLGIVVSLGLQGVLQAFGIDLPSGDTVFALRTVVVSLAVGIGVTMVAAIAPAVRSTRVAPVAALQAVAAPPPVTRGRARLIAGTILLAIGVGVLSVGLFAGGGIAVVGAGAVVTMLAVAFLSSLVTRPIVSVLGAPIAATRGIPGQLARENAARTPRRTAATASALMIGLALVSFVAILGSSISRSAEVSIDESFLAQFQVSPANQAGGPGQGSFPPQVITDLAAVPQVATASPLTFGEVRIDEGTRFVGGVDPDTIGETLALEFLAGGLADLGQGGIAISEDAAEGPGYAVGDIVDVTFASTGSQQLTVRGIFDGANLDTDWLLDDATFADNFASESIVAVYVRLGDGVSVDDARPALDSVMESYPTLLLQDLDEVKQSIRDQIGQLLGLLTALLALSVIVALFGIVNTLGLSVLERTRELGLLRAVGATRAQVRTMIRWEAVLIAVLGAALGLVVGALFGWMVVQALSSSGISQFVLPGGQLLAYVIFAALAGVGAAIVPARKAARTDVLRALEAT